MTTKLQAVNAMLKSIGSIKTDTLTEQHPDVINAIDTLEETNRDLQIEGYSFNTNLDYPLTPTTGDEIVLPPEVLSVTSTAGKYVMRGNRLYNNEDNTFTFTEEVRVNMVLEIPFEDLPMAPASWIKTKAVEAFFEEWDGETQLLKKKMIETEFMYNRFLKEEFKHNRANVKNTPWVARFLRDMPVRT